MTFSVDLPRTTPAIKHRWKLQDRLLATKVKHFGQLRQIKFSYIGGSMVAIQALLSAKLKSHRGTCSTLYSLLAIAKRIVFSSLCVLFLSPVGLGYLAGLPFQASQ